MSFQPAHIARRGLVNLNGFTNNHIEFGQSIISKCNVGAIGYDEDHFASDGTYWVSGEYTQE